MQVDTWLMVLSICFFFFFQAEDGIRDADVTGIQTCALPIWIELDGPSVLHSSLGGGPRFCIEMGEVEVDGGILRHDSASLLELCDRFLQCLCMSVVRCLLLVGKRHAVAIRQRGMHQTLCQLVAEILIRERGVSSFH